MTAYLLLPLALNPIMFTVYTIVGCLGTGFSPAVQSVAMGLYTHQGGTELGKLFGALSVMSALWYVTMEHLKSYDTDLTRFPIVRRYLDQLYSD